MDDNITHLIDAMTTEESEMTEATGRRGRRDRTAADALMMVIVIMGFIGTVGNAVILYALYASKQHKKHALIVNQNALDFCSSLFLVAIYVVHLSPNVRRPPGVPGYWLCIIFFSESLIWSAVNGSMVNLAIITVDRYLKVVYPAFSRKWIRPRVIHCAIAFAWFVGIVYNAFSVIFTTKVTPGGYCSSYENFSSKAAGIFANVSYFLFFYVTILCIFIFCYWRILLTIRRQAKVMASHSQAGPSNASQAQSHRIQTNVVKTMVFVSAFYAISWLPYGIYSSLASVFLPSASYLDPAAFVTTILAFIYTATNPFIYATKFDPVREFLVKMIPCKNPVQPTVVGGAVNAAPRPATKRGG